MDDVRPAFRAWCAEQRGKLNAVRHNARTRGLTDDEISGLLEELSAEVAAVLIPVLAGNGHDGTM